MSQQAGPAPAAVSPTADVVLQAIRQRRSVGVLQADVPPRELITQILDAGRWAPNHHLTEPWRFFVLAGSARHRLGDAMAAILATDQGLDPVDPQAAKLLERERQKPLRAPVIIVVAVEPSPDPAVLEPDEVLAGAAAAQNMLLAAHALGLAARWRTGQSAFSPQIKDFFGLTARAHVIGFLYVGYPVDNSGISPRRPLEEVTTWSGWDM